MNTAEVADHVIGMKNADNQEQLADAAVALITKSHDNVIAVVGNLESSLRKAVKDEVKAEVHKELRIQTFWMAGAMIALAVGMVGLAALIVTN